MAESQTSILRQQRALLKRLTQLAVRQPHKPPRRVGRVEVERWVEPVEKYKWNSRRKRWEATFEWERARYGLHWVTSRWSADSARKVSEFAKYHYNIDMTNFPDYAKQAFRYVITDARLPGTSYRQKLKAYNAIYSGWLASKSKGESKLADEWGKLNETAREQVNAILRSFRAAHKPSTADSRRGGDVDANTGKPLRPAQIRKTTTDGRIDTTGWTKQDLYNYARVHGAATTDPKSVYEKSYQQWKTADVAKPLTLLPEFSVQAGEFTVLAGTAVKDTDTGKVIGYIGANNQLMDLHGTVIGYYEGDRKDADKVYLAEFRPVPKREGIPYCEDKNYEKAKKYLIDLMGKGEVPGGSVLIQRHNEWVYIPPRPENETMKLGTGEWVYKQGYDKLDKDAKDYLNKWGVKQFVERYAPAQAWVGAASIKKELAPYSNTYKTPDEAYRAGIITMKELSAYKSAELFPTKDKEKYIPATTYDVAAAREGGVSDKTLLAAGFSEADIKDAVEWQGKIKSGEVIALPDRTYITKENFDKQPKGCQEILKKEGFGGYFAAIAKYSSVEEAKDIVERRTIKEWLKDNPYPGFVKSKGLAEKEWADAINNPRLRLVVLEARDKKFQEILAKMSTAERDLYYKGGAVYLQGLALTPLIMIFPPTKALKKEYDIGDVSKVEWALGAVNVALIGTAFAPGALVGSLAGRGIVTGISTTGAGLVGYEVKKHWSDLSGVERGLGIGAAILYGLPLLGSVARGIKITSGKIPTVKGDVTTWKGLTIARNPVIGRSGGKFVVGARNITLPEARLILNGYHPSSMLETKVFVNTKALQKAGFSKTQIDYLVKTLKDRNLFAGKKSPFLSKEALVEATARLDADEINALLKQISKHSKKVDQVDLLFGSPTIKAQLPPELRGWRQIHDWDIRLNVNQASTEAFAKELLKTLRKLPGNRQYRINPDKPLLVEKYIKGKWEHIADIHSSEAKPDVSEIPGSKLDATGEYSYGRLVAEPAITVKYPGAVKISIMRLSESGVRKADTILRVRQVETSVVKTPPEVGFAKTKGGVTKVLLDMNPNLKGARLEHNIDDIGRVVRNADGSVFLTSEGSIWILNKAGKNMGYCSTANAEATGIITKAEATNLMAKVTGKITAFRPPQRGIAHPGVPKDAADFYVTLRTFKGQKIADEWAEAWAKAMGYTQKELSKVLPRITKAMNEIAAQTPSDLIGYRLTPSKAPAGASPTITIHVPSSLSASVSGSLMKSITAPISPYALSASAALSLSPSQLASISPKGTPSGIVSPTISPSPQASPSLKVSPSISPSPSPSGSPSPTPTPSPSPYVSPAPGPTPSVGVVPISKKPPILPKDRLSKLTKKQREGIIAWKQGFIYRLLYPPYGVKDVIHSKKPLAGVKYYSGTKSAMKSIIAKHGYVPPEVLRDMGIMDVIIRTPWGKTSKPKLYFKRDIHQRTKTTPGISSIK